MVVERKTQDAQSSSNKHIPVVDLSDGNEELVARAVVTASEEWGIFQVVNHGIPAELIRRLQEVGKQFFELPAAEKEAVAKPDGFMEGYTKRFQVDLEKSQGALDKLIHNIWPPSCVNYRYWPTNPPDYREVNEEYARQVKKLSEKIMEWLSEGLGLGREVFKELIGSAYMMSINYYHPCPHPDLMAGLPPHTETNALTLIVPNEIPGLHVFKDDHWIDVEEVNEEYARQVKKLSEKIMEWLSEGLGLGREVFKELIGSAYMMSINYYHPCPHPDLMAGLPPHTETNALTLIVPNEIPGLHVFKDDHWIDVEEVNEEYARQVKKLSEKIMEWLSEGLGLGREVFKELIGSAYMMSINYYHPCPHPDLMAGLPPHTETNALTLIVPNEIPGLHVFKDDHWIDVEEVNEEYARQVKKLSEKIMEWLSEGLGLGREVFKELIGSAYMMSINYYHPCPHPDLMAGLPPHTETNALTLIVPNEIPGLHVFKDDHWIDVEYIPSAVIVNIGDPILMLSNGRYKSMLHKTTLDKERARISWPVLVKPNYDMVVGPLPELTSDQDPPKFIPITYKAYLNHKLPHISTTQN